MPWGTASIFIPGAREQLELGSEQTRTLYGYVLLVLGIAFRENGLNHLTAKKAIDAFKATKVSKTKKNKVA